MERRWLGLMKMGGGFTDALKLLEEREETTYLSTGCPELDHLIGDGIEPGVLYLFYGDSESGIDLFLHHLMAEALGEREGAGRVVYLNCGNYREEKTILDIPSLVRLLKACRLDPREGLDRVIVYCAFSEEQQEQVVEEVRQSIEATEEANLLVVHGIAKLFTSRGRRDKGWYRRIPGLQRAVLRLWQTCAARGLAMVASCRPVKARRGGVPRPEGGRYLSHEASVIVYLEKAGGLVTAPQAHLMKHPARARGRAMLNISGDKGLGRIAVPFNKRLEEELDSLKSLRESLKDRERQKAYDSLIRACASEEDALANASIPYILDSVLLAASVDNRRCIEELSERLEFLKGAVQNLKPWEQD